MAPYALFQYLPALLFTQLGMSDAAVYKALSVVSLVSFCAIVALATWLAHRANRVWSPAVLVVVLTTSPLVYYAWLTFGESLAALLMMMLVVATLVRWPPVAVAIVAAFACLTKETAFPVVAIVGAVSLWATPIAARPLRRAHWIGLTVGILLGVVVSAAFNWLRYEQLTNYTYGHSFEHVHGLGRRIALSVAVWVAPNGGVGWFWPLGAVLAIGLVPIAVTTLRPGRPPRPGVWAASERRTRAIPAVALIASLILTTGTLASWYAPFGWVAWGPRLMMPVLTAVLVVALVIYHPEVAAFVGALRLTTGRTVLVAVVVTVVALPEVNILHAGQVVGDLFTPDGACPRIANVQSDPGYYYHCLDHWAWDRHLVLLSTFEALDEGGGRIFAVVFSLIWVGSVCVATRSLEAHRVDGEA